MRPSGGACDAAEPGGPGELRLGNHAGGVRDAGESAEVQARPGTLPRWVRTSGGGEVSRRIDSQPRGTLRLRSGQAPRSTGKDPQVGLGSRHAAEKIEIATAAPGGLENGAVPPGLSSFFSLFPALKRWAKLARSCRDWIPDSPGATATGRSVRPRSSEILRYGESRAGR
jgi:hypothetical protein